MFFLRADAPLRGHKNQPFEFPARHQRATGGQTPPPLTTPPRQTGARGDVQATGDTRRGASLCGAKLNQLILNYRQLADLIGRPAASVRADAYRKPECLPPRLEIPGRSGLWWAMQDIEAWIAGLQRSVPDALGAQLRTPTPDVEPRRRRGRPTKAEQVRKTAAEVGHG